MPLTGTDGLGQATEGTTGVPGPEGSAGADPALPQGAPTQPETTDTGRPSLQVAEAPVELSGEQEAAGRAGVLTRQSLMGRHKGEAWSHCRAAPPRRAHTQANGACPPPGPALGRGLGQGPWGRGLGAAPQPLPALPGTPGYLPSQPVREGTRQRAVCVPCLDVSQPPGPSPHCRCASGTCLPQYERRRQRQKEPGSLWGEVVGDDLLARQESTNNSNICSRQNQSSDNSSIGPGPRPKGSEGPGNEPPGGARARPQGPRPQRGANH